MATLQGKLRPEGPELTIVALADGGAAPEPEATTADVAAIEIRRGDGSLRQRIDGLQVRIATTNDLAAFELVDFDFDGYADLRLMEAPSAGPNTSHVHWRFDPVGDRFVSIPALDELPGVKVVASARELRSQWRDGPALYGTDVYVWRDDKLVPIRRERRTYARPGAFTLEISQPDGAGWKVVKRSAGRD